MQIGLNPASGTLSGTLTATTDASGTATFATLSINNADNGYTLAAFSGTQFVTSSFFNVLAASGNIVTRRPAEELDPAPRAAGEATSYPMGFNQGIAFAIPPAIMYAADLNNHQGREDHSLRGVLTIIAGTGAAGFTGDGGPAASAQINSPAGIAVDSSNNVYISGPRQLAHPQGRYQRHHHHHRRQCRQFRRRWRPRDQRGLERSQWDRLRFVRQSVYRRHQQSPHPYKVAA